MPQSGIYHDLMQPDLRLMLMEDDHAGLHAFCEALYPVVVAEILDGLSPEEAWKVLAASGLERQAEIFEFIEPTQQMELVQAIDRQHLSKHMDEEQVEQLLPLVAQAEREDIRRLLSYEDDSCGSIMTTEYASLPEHLSVRDALEKLRQQAPDRETIYYIYICDEARHLHGVITLRQLILARPTQQLDAVMRRDVIAVHVDDPTEDAARELARFDLLAIPVVDEDQRLVGIITHDDVLDLVQEAADEDAYRQSAMEPLENSYFSTPLLTIAHKRGVWLLALSVMSLVTAAVARFFEDVGNRHGWMECFYPLVLASGGNTGSQSATLIIRAMGLSELTAKERAQAMWRELFTGLILGAFLGLFIFIAVQPLFGHSPMEASVVGLTIAAVVTMGAVTGSYLPMIFERLGMDPAVMSNPLIASLSDMFATAIYFTVAIILLETFLF
jgi:magnesium transporter